MYANGGQSRRKRFRIIHAILLSPLLSPAAEKWCVSGSLRIIATRTNPRSIPLKDDSGSLQKILDKKALSNLQTSALPLGYRALSWDRTLSVMPSPVRREATRWGQKACYT